MEISRGCAPKLAIEEKFCIARPNTVSLCSLSLQTMQTRRQHATQFAQDTDHPAVRSGDSVSANAQTIGAEDDTWITGSGTQVDFSNFGQISISQLLGSQPVNSIVSFTGVPLSSSLGSADTLVARGSVTIADRFSTTLSIKGLSLSSSPDMTLQDGRTYHVAVSLATQSNTGTINFTSTSSEGGTFSSSFTVTPIFTFTNVNNPNEAPHTINCADSGSACSFPMGGSGNWVQTSSTRFDPQSMGIPIVPSGVQIGGYTTVGKPRFGGVQVG